MSDLLSKVSASGLSAGVFLLWWPAHVASQGNTALLLRGVLWALAFEILLLGFRPLERAIGRAVRDREADVIAPRRIAPVLAWPPSPPPCRSRCCAARARRSPRRPAPPRRR